MTEQSLSSFLESLEVASTAQVNFAHFRQASGLTQSDLSKKLGKSQSYVSQVENLVRTPSIETLTTFYSAIAGGTNVEEEIN